jgi:hypothetical protein
MSSVKRRSVIRLASEPRAAIDVLHLDYAAKAHQRNQPDARYNTSDASGQPTTPPNIGRN